MKAKVLLRIAAILLLVHVIGHSFGHITWDKPEDPKMQGVVNTMQGYKAEFMGATKSMADYYNGYSLMIFFLFGMTIFILWVVSGFINTERNIATKILYPIAITYIAFGIIEYLYFFPFAAAMSFLAGVLTILAITAIKK